MHMTRQSDTQTDPATCAHGVDHDRTVPCRACEVITKYPFGRADAAKRHALALGGHVVLDDETGYWAVYGDAETEAQRVLREASTATLLRKAYRITHAMDTARPSVQGDLRAARDLITAEVIRRTEGQA